MCKYSFVIIFVYPALYVTLYIFSFVRHSSGVYVSVKSKLKHPPRAYPGHLTSFPAREGGNLMNLVFPGAGNLIAINIVNIYIFFKQLKFILETMQN